MCRFSTIWEGEVSTPTPVLLKGQLHTLWCGHLEESRSQFSRITHFTSLDYRSNLHQADLICVNLPFTVGEIPGWKAGLTCCLEDVPSESSPKVKLVGELRGGFPQLQRMKEISFSLTSSR